MFTQKNPLLYHLLALLVISYFVIFVKLDCFHMRLWDESIYSVNTYEMMQNGKYFSLYFDGAPDLFNTKPPLINWIQICFVKLIGYNELALRLPSAIAAALTVLVLFVFLYKNMNSLVAWLSALILITSSGFIGFHTARTGDTDALLTFFLTTANICFLTYILKNNKRYIFYFFVFLSLAFATKLHASLLFAPAYLIILIQNKKAKGFFINLNFLSGFLIFLILACCIMYLRELSTPGYISKVFSIESKSILDAETHRAPITFYLNNFIQNRFSFWMIFFVLGTVLVFMSNKQFETKILTDFLTLCLGFLLLISISGTKLDWYDMPLYPYMSAIAAYPMWVLIKNNALLNQSSSVRPIIFILIFLFALPYYRIFEKSQGNSIHISERIREANEEYLFKKSKQKISLDKVHVYFSGFKSSLLFYKYKLAELNQNIVLDKDCVFSEKDKVLVSDDSLLNVLTKRYNYTIIDKNDHSQLLLITGKIN